MIRLWEATCRILHAWPRHAGRGQESCLSESVHDSSVQQLFEYVLRLRWSFYLVFPWDVSLVGCLVSIRSTAIRRRRRYNPRCLGYECQPSHPYLRHYLDCGCRTRCRFRLVSLFLLSPRRWLARASGLFANPYRYVVEFSRILTKSQNPVRNLEFNFHILA